MEKTRPKPVSAASAATGTTLTLQGRSLALSNLDKVLYPKTGFTKGQVIDYYARVAKVLLPHLKDRPLTLKRYPDGVEQAFFYEKRCPSFRPSWVKTAPVWSDRQQEEISFCLANDLPTLVWAANLANLELHTSLARYRNIECPTVLAFDLDPGPGADVLSCAETALWLREFLSRQKLKSWPKTSGSKGLQIYAPLNTATTFDQTKQFAREVAGLMAAEQPDRVVARMEKSLRSGKVFIDWSQNDAHKTTVCVYSLRARERPLVSTPVNWDEVELAVKRRKAELLAFESSVVLERIEKFGDLFEPVLTLKQKLPPR